MSAQAPPRIPRFDMYGMDPARRGKAWADALNEHIYSFETEYPRDFLTGEYEGVVAEDLRVATITSDPLHVERRASHVARDSMDGYLLVLPASGDLMIGQRGREVTIRRGQFTLVSTTEPSSYRQNDTERLHTLLVPGPLVRARKPDVDDHLGGSFGASGLQQVFADFAASFCHHAHGLGREALWRTHDSLLDMLALVLERTDDMPNETVVRMAHRRRIVKLVESRFRDPGIGVAAIAQALDLSPRYVQQILSAHGETVSDLLRERRMAEACRMLDRRGASRAPVATIAYAVGYTDPAYFSRVFRQSLGLSPMDYAAREGG